MNAAFGGTPLDTHDALGLADLVRRRAVSPRELLDDAMARLDAWNPSLNAVVTKTFEQAARAARAIEGNEVFAGVPFLLKDLGPAMAGVPLACGSEGLRDYVPSHDDELVRRYRKAGLLILGRTNTSEFGLTPVVASRLHGPARNPWATTRNTLGSSGGSAAAVAARIVPFAHASDGAGSIRLPASACGVFGFKPSRDRMPVEDGAPELLSWLSVEHAVTLSVRDCAALLDVTGERGPPASVRGQETRIRRGSLRIALSLRPLVAAGLAPECAAATRETAQLLEDLGHTVEEFDFPLDRDRFLVDFLTVVLAASALGLDYAASQTGRPLTRRDVESGTWMMARLGARIGALELHQAKQRLIATARGYRAHYADHDAILTPTAAALPPWNAAPRASWVADLVNTLVGGLGFAKALALEPAVLARVGQPSLGYIGYTAIANVTGQPSMSVPLAWTAAGMPCGSLLTGHLGRDAELLCLAADLEEARPWKNRRPPLPGEFPPDLASAGPGAGRRAGNPGETPAHAYQPFII